MRDQYTPTALLQPLGRQLGPAHARTLLLLLLALQLGRTFVTWQLSLFVLAPIASASCYRRLSRFLSWKGWKDEGRQHRLRRAWVRLVLRHFAPHRGRLVLLIDWTLHTDRCRSLWVMLPVGGRAVPVCFWLTETNFGGEGKQREFEDRCLEQLAGWLPRKRRVVLVGDRGFRGADRMDFLQRKLGWDYVLRISSETMIQLKAVPGQWLPLSRLAPPLGGRWEHADVLCGRTTRKQAGRGKRVKVFANLVAVRQPLLLPRRRRNNQGKPTGELLEETTWFLATSLPRGTGCADVVELYQRRMQIEQTFRDFKSLWGMEREYTRQPHTRLEALLWAATCGMALDLQAAPAVPQASPPKRYRKEGSASAAEPLRYPQESATRTGMHQLLVQTLLQHGALWEPLREVATISTRMQARPQVASRRRDTPALYNRSRTLHAPSPP